MLEEAWSIRHFVRGSAPRMRCWHLMVRCSSRANVILSQKLISGIKGSENGKHNEWSWYGRRGSERRSRGEMGARCCVKVVS